MFQIDDWVIDTKRKTAPTVKAIFPNTSPVIYVLQDDEGEYYIEDEFKLIAYDKNWFEFEEDK